jgi:hypothetical protein
MGEPARLGLGELLAGLGELPPGRAAEALASWGVPVLPLYEPGPDGICICPAGQACGKDTGKHPRIAGGLHAASTDTWVVRGWWRRWPGANLGARTGVRFDVCDLDGSDGVEALRGALSIAPLEHAGPVARSGAGGWHLLFAPTGMGNRVGLLPGVDWRGRHGYIVLPPSRHRSGRHYTWQQPLTSELPETPEGLWRLLVPAAVKRTTLPPAPRVAGDGGQNRAERYARAALQREAVRVRTALPGSCNDTLNRAAFNLGQLVHAGLLDPDQVRAVLMAAALAAPSTGHPDRERKAAATITSGLRGGAAKPRRRRDGAA